MVDVVGHEMGLLAGVTAWALEHERQRARVAVIAAAWQERKVHDCCFFN